MSTVNETPNMETDVCDIITECADVKDCKEALEAQVAMLQKALDEKEEELKILEEDRTFLRRNIKKASAHWFERKAKLSESDSDGVVDVVSRQNSNGAETNNDPIPIKDPPLKKEVEIQVNLTSNTCTTTKNHTPQDFDILTAELAYKTELLELSERKCTDLNKRLKEYENIIDDQEIIIHGMKSHLDTYFDDNQKLSRQIIELNKLFESLELSDNTNVNIVDPPDNTSAPISTLPSEKDFKDMASSVSKTYIKLKDLIYEKKALVTEIERLQTLNVELQRRVVQQESRLFSVSDAIHKTWMLVSDLKDQHAEIHESKTVLRYELKEKREILQKLRQELESSREQWVLIREKNSESEKEWKNIHDELAERRRIAAERKDGQESMSDILKGAARNEKPTEFAFEPPIDLLMDMGIEYGCIDADDETSTTVIAAVEGEDVHGERLQDLEDQCSYLYQKLMSSTARSLALASQLSSLHEHYGDFSDDDDEDEDSDDNDNFNDETDANFFESDMATPDSDSYDTAYVSEPDLAESGSTTGLQGTLSEDETVPAISSLVPVVEGLEGLEPEAENEESCDLLSRRLINFLPKKIEILRAENKKLEEKCTTLQDEKHKMEVNYTSILDSERLIRRQLEDAMRHLGKCVDELKLERNGKIAEYEKQLRQKVEKLDAQEKSSEELQEQLDDLNEKFEERGKLFQLTIEQLQQKEATIENLQVTVNKLEMKMQNLASSSTMDKITENASAETKVSQSIPDTSKEAKKEDSLPNELFEGENSTELSNQPKKNVAEDAHSKLEDDIEEEEIDAPNENPNKIQNRALKLSSELKMKEHTEEIWVHPSNTVAVPVKLEAGDVLSLSVKAYPQTTWITLIYHPDEICHREDSSPSSKLVFKRTKLMTEVSAVYGTLIARLNGIYTFLFDNKSSRYTSRKIECKFLLNDTNQNTTSDSSEDLVFLSTAPLTNSPPINQVQSVSNADDCASSVPDSHSQHT